MTRRATGGAFAGVPERPFPAQTIRDLIGIARLLYRNWSSHGLQQDKRLPELVAIGKDLQTALKLSRVARPNTKQQREAWELAELATRKLGYLVDAYVGVKPLITSAFDVVDQTAGQSKAAKSRR